MISFMAGLNSEIKRIIFFNSYLLFPALPGLDFANMDGSRSSRFFPLVLNSRIALSSRVLEIIKVHECKIV